MRMADIQVSIDMTLTVTKALAQTLTSQCAVASKRSSGDGIGICDACGCRFECRDVQALIGKIYNTD